METLSLIFIAIIGTILASVLALIPALHIYNVVGLLILSAGALSSVLNPDQLAMLLLGMIVGYAMLSTIPSIFVAAPDEAAAFIVLPGQKWLLERRGYEAAILTGVGALCGLAVLIVISPVAAEATRVLQIILSPHLGWILATIIVFMLMSEWPKSGDRGSSGWARFRAAWTGLGAGLLTFLLSGLLGIIIMYRSVVPTEIAFQNLLPAFLGLYAIPMVLTNLIMGTQVPKQHIASSIDITPGLLFRGAAAGSMGGLFAAFFPVVTGGIGGFLAGHATAQRDERSFIVSQGTSKFVYYVGGFLLFFLPGLHRAKGGMAQMLSTIYTPATPELYFTVIAAMAICGAIAFFLLILFSRLAIKLIDRIDYRVVSIVTLILLITLIFLTTGLGGLLIALPATAIGLIPSLFGSRRMNCLGILLIPITLNMAGVGASIAHVLGLI
ncbi:MAG TPA: tripartite tricarboxylate transporter permease [Anaerolineae bacterium]|nr:tripartite tricarboxylate transporter permease [Anaerolineae bacterium]